MNPGKIIDELGGTSVVAGFFSIRPPSVSEWRSNGIPKDRLICLAPMCERKGIASRKELFPNEWHLIWPELVGVDSVHQPTEQEGEVGHV
ncbi:MAG TPA: hypothetical protein DCX50_01605 [Limnobacter sp.]|nr:hypothetical protein [Sutterellaceae bacterium]HAV73653.1 hypothetical protein [Limnobacter sp.]|tara:strand:+ start:90 stop:359 length:270 start_codon:yes stop_codon:yes gene_type:complete